jgi:hypothetical protein
MKTKKKKKKKSGRNPKTFLKNKKKVTFSTDFQNF